MSFAKIAEARAVKKIVALLRQRAAAENEIPGLSNIAFQALDAAANVIEAGEWKDVVLPKPPRKSEAAIKFACHACARKVPAENILSRHPPSCECGRYSYPHSHRGRAEITRHRCAFCSCDLEFYKESDSVDAVSFEGFQVPRRQWQPKPAKKAKKK